MKGDEKNKQTKN